MVYYVNRLLFECKVKFDLIIFNSDLEIDMRVRVGS